MKIPKMDSVESRNKDEQEVPMAFPCIDNGNIFSEGMELRDWFAGQALNRWIASVTVAPEAKSAAEHCYYYADAMMEARKKKS